MKRYMVTTVAVIIAIAAVMIILDKSIDKMVTDYDAKLGNTYHNSIGGHIMFEKSKGIELVKRSLRQEDNFILYGSSELGDDFVDKMFKGKKDGFQVNKVGRGFYKNIMYSMSIAAMSNELKNKKIVISLSPEWFNMYGITQKQFGMNFSELQFYTMIYNNSLSEKVKQKIAYRVFLLDKVNFSKVYAFFYYNNNIITNLIVKTMDPVIKIRYKYLVLKDKMAALRVMEKYKEEETKKVYKTENINWENEREKAFNYVKERSKNEYYIYDDRYDGPKERREHLVGAQMMTTKSPEYYDLEILLELCKEVNAKPLFIISPFHAKYVEAFKVGQKKAQRQEYYNKVKEMISKSNFDIVDLSKYEDTPYFMHDGLHMSMYGWTFVEEEMSKYWKK